MATSQKVVLLLERGWTDAKAVSFLEARGHEIGYRDEIGVVQLIRVHAGRVGAASDPRKGGAPAGY